jgi:hypothetical protein
MYSELLKNMPDIVQGMDLSSFHNSRKSSLMKTQSEEDNIGKHYKKPVDGGGTVWCNC